MPNFSLSQQKALAVAPKISGFLSIFGSSWIVIEVLSQRTKRQNVYNRLLCAMSFFDIFNSASMMTSTWAIPKEETDVVWNVGTEKSCTIQGFLVQTSIITPIYNFSLIVYYMLVIKYGVSEDSIRRGVEPIMHFLAVGFGFGTAIAGLTLNLYNDANLWCWIASYPGDCRDSRDSNPTCTRGEDFWIYRWAFYYIPLWFLIVAVTIIMASVYLTVKQREKASKAPSTSSGLRQSAISGGKSVQRSINAPKKGRKSTRSSMIVPKKMISKKGRSSRYFSRLFSSMSLHEKEERRQSTEDVDYVVSIIDTFATAYNQNIQVNDFGSRSIFQQSVYYTLAFYVTFTAATVNRLLQEVGETNFAILFLHALLIPLQGFFNFMIYRYAFFFRLKQRYPEMKTRQLMFWSIRWSFMGPARHLENSQKNKTEGGVAGKEDNDKEGALNNDLRIDSGGDYDEIALSGIMADMMFSFSEYPNMLADEDVVMLTTQFPTMIESQEPTLDPNEFDPRGVVQNNESVRLDFAGMMMATPKVPDTYTTIITDERETFPSTTPNDDLECD